MKSTMTIYKKNVIIFSNLSNFSSTCDSCELSKVLFMSNLKKFYFDS